MSLEVETRTHERPVIIAGDFPIVTRSVVLNSGENLKEGSIVGKKTRLIESIIAGVGNVGNGTIGDVSMGLDTKKGTFIITCISSSSPTFQIWHKDEDDNLQYIGSCNPATSDRHPYKSTQINFEITVGGIAFAAGDSFEVKIADDPSNNYVLSVKSAVDGSSNFENMGILMKDTDASLANKTTVIWISGQFNQRKLVYGTGWTYENLRDNLRKYNIYLEDSVKVEAI